MQPQRHTVGRLHRQMIAQRPPGQQENLQRPFDALTVARLQPRGGGRIHLAQTAVQPLKPLLRLLRLQLRTHASIGLRQIVQTVYQRVEIHHRTADNQRHTPARTDFAAQAQAVGGKLRRAVRLQRRNDVD